MAKSTCDFHHTVLKVLSSQSSPLWNDHFITSLLITKCFPPFKKLSLKLLIFIIQTWAWTVLYINMYLSSTNVSIHRFFLYIYISLYITLYEQIWATVMDGPFMHWNLTQREREWTWMKPAYAKAEVSVNSVKAQNNRTFKYTTLRVHKWPDTWKRPAAAYFG